MTVSKCRQALIVLGISLGLSGVANAQNASPTWSYAGNYTADVIGVVSGGLDQGVRYLDNFGLQLSYDGTAHKLKGITATIGVLYNSKASISELSGDLQGISNIETGTTALRPYEVWIAKTWGEDSAMLKAGLIDLNGTFDAPGVSALFLNPSHGINAAFAQSGANGPSIFPTLGLAVVGQAKLTNSIVVRAGAFDAVPGDPDKPERIDLAWRESDGALWVGEAEVTSGPARFVVGAWGYTQPTQGLSFLAPQSRNTGLYGTGEYKQSEALSYFVRLGYADKDINLVETYLAGGAVWTGPISGRDADELGFAIAHARLSSEVVKTGLTKEAETNFELTYAAKVTSNLTLQGDLQYVANPSGAIFVDKATIIGLRAKFSFGG
jgi:porin